MTTCSCVFSANRRGEWRGNDSHLSLTVKVSLDRGERGAAEQSAGSDGRLTLFHSHSLLSPLLSSPLCASKVNDPREEREKGKGKKRGSTAVLLLLLLLLSTTLNRKSDSLTNPSSSITVHPLSPFWKKKKKKKRTLAADTHTHTQKSAIHLSGHLLIATDSSTWKEEEEWRERVQHRHKT